MKKIILLTLALLVLQAAPPAWAWTYNDGDLLLIFRSPTGSGLDIEYDLGTVSNYLNLASGTTVTNLGTGWNTNVVTTNGYASFSGVDYLLLAVTKRTSATPTAWITGAEPDTTAYNESQSGFFTRLYSVINAVGNRPLHPIAITTANANAYAIDPGGLNQYSSYDYIAYPGQGVSGGPGGISLGNILPSLGGNAPFIVEQAVPGQLDFWQVQATTSPTNNPPPDKLIGTFNLDTSGNLVFTAGPRATTINSVSRAGNVSTLSFPTVVGNHYSVVYTNQLVGAVTNWPVDTSTTLVGNGYTDTITHTNSSGTAEFYRIQTQ
jgi:hypothetical protein